MIIQYSNQFKKDYKRSLKQRKDASKLEQVIQLLLAGETLNPKYKDHGLIGEFKDFRDCHISPDWILIYKIEEDVLRLERTGSHSELFK
ncbi:type II toxin-antitoxin system YafQ family toxin [bacterium]|nr:type II toxin-antitoxin system YafQ family toxin [bacterium]